MKIQAKLVIYNALSKALIIAAFGLLLPQLVERVVYSHIDSRLMARRDMLIKKIQVGGLDQALMEEDCSYDDYNIFKEEFVKIEALTTKIDSTPQSTIANETWDIEDAHRKQHRVIRVPFMYDNQWYEMNIGEGLNTIDQLKNTIISFTLLTMIIVILISIFIDIGFVQLILRPFYRIVSTKLKAAKDPTTFNFTPIKSSTYEFSYLDESINELMRKTKDAFAIEREFISNVSHELLTPISILQNRLENIVSDTNTPHEVSLKIIESQKTLSRLSKIIRALLLISKIENEQYLKNESVSIRTMVDEVLDEIEERLNEKNIELKKLIYDDYVFSPANKSLLHTLLFNLVNNAIKYNRENGCITVTGRKKEQYYQLEITDTGIGIEQSQIAQVFDRFKKSQKADENSYGLGLPIVKTVANFHHIKIDVVSILNSGTTFTLKFPYESVILQERPSS